VQHGHSSPIGLEHAELVDFLPFEAMVETIRRARVVVTHSGVGSVMVSLANAKRPIVVPRKKSFGEAVDDHQLQLGRRFAEAGLVTLVEEPAALGEALTHAHEAASVVPSSSSLAVDLGTFLEGAVASPA
jgi:UDP-N-acetylglucosamine transferase subunit ALG13